MGTCTGQGQLAAWPALQWLEGCGANSEEQSAWVLQVCCAVVADGHGVARAPCACWWAGLQAHSLRGCLTAPATQGAQTAPPGATGRAWEACSTWGMMFFSSASLYRGAGGRSRPSMMQGTLSTTSCTCPLASGLEALPVPARVVASSWPCTDPPGVRFQQPALKAVPRLWGTCSWVEATPALLKRQHKCRQAGATQLQALSLGHDFQAAAPPDSSSLFEPSLMHEGCSMLPGTLGTQAKASVSCA